MATLAVGRSRRSTESRFFAGMGVAMFAAVFLGFSRSFFLRPWFPDHPAPAERLFYVHGAAFTAWVVLLVVQPLLVAAGRTDVHRKLGVAGGVLAAAMVTLGVVGSLVAARRATGFVGVPVPALQFLAVPLFDMALFAAFVGLAIAWRRDAQSHKRLMLLATVNLLAAGIARWPFGFVAVGPPAYFGLADLFIVALAAWDLVSRARLHPATLWGGAAIVVSQPLRLVVSGTDAWASFARWAVDLLG
ncbi:MAG: hypothetical protein ACHQM7_01765 [Vicinamibacterales bacterium]|jgi:hypothetical protein